MNNPKEEVKINKEQNDDKIKIKMNEQNERREKSKMNPFRFFSLIIVYVRSNIP